jgi:hypothetical protein
MNLPDPQILGNYRETEQTVTSQEGLSCSWLVGTSELRTQIFKTFWPHILGIITSKWGTLTKATIPRVFKTNLKHKHYRHESTLQKRSYCFTQTLRA